MSDIPLGLRQQLSADFTLRYFTTHDSIVSSDMKTQKHVFLTEDNTGIEVVVLRDESNRMSFCISSQIGCSVGCTYCATGARGFSRNLSAGEIVNQVLSLERLHGRPDSILFMGMGEPLLNYNEVVRGIELLIDTGFSPRRITVSTCGIVKKIYELAGSGLKPRLAVSIGSAFEKKRKIIIPLSSENSLPRLKKAIRHYHEKTRRRVTLEYTVIAGINDTKEDAAALARFALDVHAHVNIIRYNRIDSGALQSKLPFLHVYKTPTGGRTSAFTLILSEFGVCVSERYRRGNDIAAACGQLIWHSPSEQ